MTTKSKAVVNSVVEPKVEKKVGIGSTIVEMILANPEKPNREILEEILAKFQNAKTTYACIAWYRSDLRKKGQIGPRVFAKKVKTEEAKA
jgi:hypothetical protein